MHSSELEKFMNINTKPGISPFVTYIRFNSITKFTRYEWLFCKRLVRRIEFLEEEIAKVPRRKIRWNRYVEKKTVI